MLPKPPQIFPQLKSIFFAQFLLERACVDNFLIGPVYEANKKGMMFLSIDVDEK